MGGAGRDENGDQLCRERRLPGAGAAGDDAQAPFQRRAQRGDRFGGSILAVVEHPLDRGRSRGNRPGVSGEFDQPRGQPGFGVEQPVQVEAIPVHDQGAISSQGLAGSDDRAAGQRVEEGCAPGKCDRLQFRGQRLRRSARVGPLDEGGDRLAGSAQVQAGVAVPVNRACRRGRERHLFPGAEVRHQPGEAAVDVGEDAGPGQGVDLGVPAHRGSPKHALIASMQARDGRRRNTPLPGTFGLMPRRKR